MENVSFSSFIDVDEYEQLKLAASKLSESEKIIKEHLIIVPPIEISFIHSFIQVANQQQQKNVTFLLH